jgi:hypothetical protein
LTRGPFLTPTELCARWSIDRRTLDKLFGSRLPVLKVTARVWRIDLADVEAYEQSERISQHRAT